MQFIQVSLPDIVYRDVSYMSYIWTCLMRVSSLQLRRMTPSSLPTWFRYSTASTMLRGNPPHIIRARGYITKYIHIQSTTVYVPSSELRLSHPFSRQRVCPSPWNQRGRGHTRLRVRGWGSPNSDDCRKSLAPCLLCGLHHIMQD
jgi:hypothetical protein